MNKALYVSALLFWSQGLFAADLYVSTSGSDSNAGTQSAPLRTISQASQLAQPGTTVHVAPGTYLGSFTTSASGTSSAYIKYVSDVKWGAKLIPASSTSDTGAWDSTGSYTVIDGFDIDGQSSLGWRRGIHATGSHTIIQNNHVHHIGMQSACDSNGGAGIIGDGYFGGAFFDVLNNVTDHIGPPNWVCTYYHGIYMSTFDFTVKNNLSFQNGGCGIHMNHDWGRGYVINNTVFRNKIGILAEGADFNHITVAGPITIENNLAYDNDPNGSAIGNVAGIGVVLSVTNNNVVANNYAYNNRDLEVWLPSGDGTMSGNITSGMPGFVNYVDDGSGDYHLTSSSQLIDVGLSTYAPSYDLDGNPRPQGAGVDIGAYEYGSPAPSPSPSPTPTPVPTSSQSPSPAPSPTLTVSTTSVAPGGSFTVKISGMGQDATAWAALYLASAADSNWSYQNNWMYLNGSQTAPSSPISSATLNFVAPLDPGTYNIRLFANSGYGTRVAMSSNITVAAAPAPDTTPPVTSITSPVNGSTVVPRTTVTIAASASDNVGVKSVNFYVNGNLKCTVTAAPYSCNWSVPRYHGKTYQLRADGVDAAGNVGSSAIVSVTSQ